MLQAPAEPCTLLSVAVVAPAAGANYSIAVPAGKRWEVLGLVVQFVAGAAVATRELRALYRVGGVAFFVSPQMYAHIAGQTRYYVYNQGAPTGPNIDATFYCGGLPIGCVLSAGWTIEVQVTAIQAADQITPLRLVVREWAEPIP